MKRRVHGGSEAQSAEQGEHDHSGQHTAEVGAAGVDRACQEQPDGCAEEAERHQRLDADSRHQGGADAHAGADSEAEREVAQTAL